MNNVERRTAPHSGIELQKANFGQGSAHSKQQLGRTRCWGAERSDRSGLRAGAGRIMLRREMLIFVYGTLRRGEPNHRELGAARFVSYASTAPCYELVDLGHYPALLDGGRDAVRGELYEVSESHLEHLDAFEDVPELYERKRIDLSDGRFGAVAGVPALVFGYVMRREVAAGAARVASGDWCTFRGDAPARAAAAISASAE